ncbi:tRNA threonylcarbamoyl adenosine modification protein YeaZ [Clostridium acetobutylicum]|uniref:Inactive homolog of metal-dependent proteases. YDIC B.subtilis ortholog n=1 Tax=Clostridium acetobutylicum (strain ATCC 824 / DSM 792 / JCM 1419 / IAM 19013 / LMG 5710 / NBRC 13948 / NRRL B-527 / VKM B-1787 / 2291 / W) TaxID=272562 RepID=Q97FA1_CLOAB|nr:MULTISPECIES: tRNA (adenosine(37)-N6)-threonylcarbamoyltransferase complex dimerization subunit type 1 TsaB [Clostridium]AAK80783.1 Inactive homolog of metal-dependent proteases. YDIC B.subtilis ortholog [Clostridium acetobutylicum ATCC 824]ADZ21884.1 Metal-dependent protease [Clostridium acetobutylicum EA 2018]AEI34087.1 hypothetical protein SMB_G2875 [Clostridium acetobutylicum DSM 1731]AWV78805.1 tRNA (adenosine(37)-N6)-threonylcarbamoyltransferase complex dimerization subunit type 1 TsaB
MKLLAIDSATQAATCAVMDDDKLLGEITFNYKKQHSVILMSMIDDMLNTVNLKVEDLDGFVVSKGPGSFTGLRIGMSIVKGLSEGSKKPFVSVSSLDALAYNMAYTPGIICPVLDALRDNVYTALYTFEGNSLKRLTEYDAIHITELIELLKGYDSQVTFIGDAVYKFRNFFDENVENVQFAPAHLNLVRSSSLCELGMELLKSGVKDDLITSAPIYIRKSQAEREYEKRTGMSIDD